MTTTLENGYVKPENEKWLIFTVIMSSFVSVINTSNINIAIPTEVY